MKEFSKNMNENVEYYNNVLEPLTGILEKLPPEVIEALPLYFEEDCPITLASNTSILHRICFSAALRLGELGLFVIESLGLNEQRSR